jgi:hypothetical protein
MPFESAQMAWQHFQFYGSYRVSDLVKLLQQIIYGIARTVFQLEAGVGHFR